MVADGLPELDLNIDNVDEASSDDNDDGCPGNAENGLENENYVRESAINNLKHKPIHFFSFFKEDVVVEIGEVVEDAQADEL